MSRSSRNGSEGGVAAALRADRISKAFGSTQALDEVSFEIARGTVHALLGGNGSGKSTLIKVLAGVHRADGGTIELLGTPYRADGLSPAIAREAGLRFVHQDLGLFPTLSIAENIAHGRGFERGAFKPLSWRRQRQHAKRLLERHRIDARPADPLDTLRPAEQTMVAVARALQDDTETSLLVLDEPTASLDHDESEHLLQAMRHYAEAGQTIILVSHRIEEVMSVADAVTVLRDGKHVITRSTEGLSEAELVQHIIGRKLERFYPSAHSAEAREVVCKVDGLRGGPVSDVSFEVGRGEILGLGGLVGSGRTELLRMLFGADQADAGTIAIEGKTVAPRNPAQAIRAGIAYVPEDRGGQAAFLSMPVRENLTMPDLGRYIARGRISKRRERAHARELVSRYRVVTGSEQSQLSSLSGGNQQKVILGRWLSIGPKLLLLDEPTQGVDVGARADLYKLVREAVDAGAAAIVVSSDLEELAHVADRVLVLSRGRIRAELHTPIDSHHLTELAHQGWQGEMS